MALQRGERGGRALVTYIQPFRAMQCAGVALKGWARLARLQLRRAGVEQEEPASLLQVERK